MAPKALLAVVTRNKRCKRARTRGEISSSAFHSNNFPCTLQLGGSTGPTRSISQQRGPNAQGLDRRSPRASLCTPLMRMRPTMAERGGNQALSRRCFPLRFGFGRRHGHKPLRTWSLSQADSTCFSMKRLGRYPPPTCNASQPPRAARRGTHVRFSTNVCLDRIATASSRAQSMRPRKAFELSTARAARRWARICSGLLASLHLPLL